MSSDDLVTYCGWYCGYCARWREHEALAILAGALAELTDSHGFHHWMPEYVKEFDYAEFRKGLDFFHDTEGWLRCRVGCKGGSGMPDCRFRKCCVEHGVELCFDCDEFPCDKNSDDARMLERAEEYRKLGRDGWIRRQAETAQRGYEDHARRYYRVRVSEDPPD